MASADGPIQIRDPERAAQHLEERRHLAAAVADQFHVVGEQRPDRVALAACRGAREALDELPVALARYVEAPVFLLHARRRAVDELAAGRFALVEQLRDFRVVALERLAQQECRAFLGREPFEHPQ
ncbi:Uncharacterised protein [Burkholderia pseudomallei]|nr:Uncharacterised protein [Burkholderia pseudomallei]CAJ4570425.1 Uncharacterised protein [Burkholderia pseudomallei]CAJ4901831.1 Uncharacterised protein [Burkholderia pseudomallei]